MTYKEAIEFVKQAALMDSPVKVALGDIAESYDNVGKMGVGDRIMQFEPAATNFYNRMARQEIKQDALSTLAGMGAGGLSAASVYGLTGLIPRLKKSKLLRVMLAGLGGGLGYTAGKLWTGLKMHPFNPDIRPTPPRLY